MREEIELLDLEDNKPKETVETIDFLEEDLFQKNNSDSDSVSSLNGTTFNESLAISSSYNELSKTLDHFEAVRTITEPINISIAAENNKRTVEMTHFTKSNTEKVVLEFNDVIDFDKNILPRFIEKYASKHMSIQDEKELSSNGVKASYITKSDDQVSITLENFDTSMITLVKEIIKKQNSILDYKRKPYNQMAVNNQYRNNYRSMGYTSPFLLAFISIVSIFVTLLLAITSIK